MRSNRNKLGALLCMALLGVVCASMASAADDVAWVQAAEGREAAGADLMARASERAEQAQDWLSRGWVYESERKTHKHNAVNAQQKAVSFLESAVDQFDRAADNWEKAGKPERAEGARALSEEASMLADDYRNTLDDMRE